jgi:hypothetical protein
MPVSKKRKKDGKPVHHAQPIAAGSAHAHGPDTEVAAPVGPPPLKTGKPANPFVSPKSVVRGAQRGR